MLMGYKVTIYFDTERYNNTENIELDISDVTLLIDAESEGRAVDKAIRVQIESFPDSKIDHITVETYT